MIIGKGKIVLTFDEAIEKIDSLLTFGMKPGLERISKLLGLMGNPQDKLRFIHVAGTNGKGSVCHMAASVLTKAGYRTGLFTSPHIVSFGERIRIDFEEIPGNEVVRQVETLFPLVEKLRNDGDIITEFEFVTAMAFNYFYEQGVDVVVLETGLGGRYDATNVIKAPLCSVITSISLDHTAVLGDTLEKIAAEKCGIIKENCITVCGFENPNLDDAVHNVIRDTALQRNNAIVYSEHINVISSDISGTAVSYANTTMKLPLVGEHQIKNLSLALSVIRALNTSECGLKISDKAVVEGIESVKIPARFEVISQSPLIIIDGAHNPGGLEALAASIDKYLSGKHIICVMGMLKDKDCKSSLSLLSGKIDTLIATTVADSPRRQTAAELAQTASAYFENIIVDENALHAASAALELAQKTENSAVLVCGSLYLAADIRRAFAGQAP